MAINLKCLMPRQFDRRASHIAALRRNARAAALIVLAALLACSSAAFAGAPGLDDGRGDPLIRIMAMSPAGSAPLSLGSTVTVEVTVAYILHDKTGKVALVVSDDARQLVAETSTDITEGSAETTLRLAFVVPSSKMLTVKALLTTADLKPFAKDARTYSNIYAGPLAPGASNPKRNGK